MSTVTDNDLKELKDLIKIDKLLKKNDCLINYEFLNHC